MKRVRKFKERRIRVHDEERSGPVITDDLMQKAIETKIRENRRFTISNLSLEFPDISRSVVYKTVLKTSTLRLLTPEHKEKRFATSMDFLIRSKEEGDDMLSGIVTGDETWVSHITLESKQQSMEWTHASSPVKVKAKQTLSKRKIMVPTEQIYGSYEEHCKTNGATCLSKGVLLLNDNERVHTSRATWDLIESFGWDALDHAPYRPDLTPRDFHHFRYLKHNLGGKHFSDNEEVQAAVNSWLSDQAADFFEEGS
ncbi:histone-lysine N-methyltransferase SETMAR [Trichonephila clavipes]|nr:histone-lysine N-methyltransferase SETMAR [Trichonephila clavipes]